MSATENSRMAERIQRASQRLARLQARTALKAMREATLARSRERRLHARKQRLFAEAVIDAGLGGWTREEITGLLMTGQEHFGRSDTTRKMFRHRAEQASAQNPSA